MDVIDCTRPGRPVSIETRALVQPLVERVAATNPDRVLDMLGAIVQARRRADAATERSARASILELVTKLAVEAHGSLAALGGRRVLADAVDLEISIAVRDLVAAQFAEGAS